MSRLADHGLSALEKGYADAAAVAVLRKGQFEQTVEILYAIRELAGEETLAAFTLLELAREANTTKYEQALQYPFVAAWAWETYNALMNGAQEGELHRHLDHLNGVAASAAFRCGVDFDIRTQTLDGVVALPSLGVAVFDNPERRPATISCSAGELTIKCDDQTVCVISNEDSAGPRWLPVRRVVTQGGSHVLEVAIDDVDPYRATHSNARRYVAARRLDAVSFKDWSEDVADAWMQIANDHSDLAAAIAAATQVLVPLADGKRPSHDRSLHAFGAIATANVHPRFIALAMLEEFCRATLSAANHYVALHDAHRDAPAYVTPWEPYAPISFRKYFEATYAIPACVSFWRRVAISAVDPETRIYAQMHVLVWQARMDQCRGLLIHSGRLTDEGRLLVDNMPTSSDIRTVEDIPPEVHVFARFTELDTKLSARLQMLRPDAFSVDRLCAAWKAAEPAPRLLDLRNEFVETPAMRAWRSRRWLAYRRIADPEWFSEIIASEHYLRVLDESADPLDALLVDSQNDVVVAACIERIEGGSCDPELWLRLALACRHRKDLASFALLHSPELVFATFETIRLCSTVLPDPLELAAWTAPALGGTER